MKYFTWILLLSTSMCLRGFADQILMTPSENLSLDQIKTVDSTVALLQKNDAYHLNVQTGHNSQWPSISIFPPEGTWDLTQYDEIQVQVTNTGDSVLPVSIRVDSKNPKGSQDLQTGGGDHLKPGETSIITVPLRRFNDGAPVLSGMDNFPQGFWAHKNIVPSQISRVNIFLFRPIQDHQFLIHSIKATGQYIKEPWELKPANEFFPFIDQFGQFIHRDWPGKIKTIEDMKQSVAIEEAELKAKSSPENWNEYGGWMLGPEFKATGHFRTKKVDGKWWLVDPTGHLFFSHGITCVGNGGSTIVEKRSTWFEHLPQKSDETSTFFSQQKNINRGDYKGSTLETFNFGANNLFLKYGNNWDEMGIDMSHRRLRSWGMNTLGLWAKNDVYAYPKRRTPYTVWAFYWPVTVKGKSQGWKGMPDVYDPENWKNAKQGFERFLPNINEDPYCLGIFVDNELPWHEAHDYGLSVLQAPAKQMAKRAFVDDLKNKYVQIDALNQAWGAKYKSWNEVLQSQNAPKIHLAKEDLEAFGSKSAEMYFKTMREISKAHAPDKLYLGCRFNGDYLYAAEQAAKYCDVLSYNLYRYSVQGFQPVGGRADVPMMITEWHFGANDRGLFGAGLKPVKSQAERAQKYREFFGEAIDNPNIVGTHWFQYRDEPVTARPADGENHQIGFVDITDRPYPETVAAARDVGYNMYQRRYGK